MRRSLLLLVLRLSIARPWLTVALSIAVAMISLAYARMALTFETSSVRLLPQNRVYVQRFQHYLQEFGDLNDIVIVVESPDIERSKDYAERLADELARPPLSVARVNYRIDPERFGGRALLYLSTDELADLRDRVAKHHEFVEEYAAKPTLARLIQSVNREILRKFAGRFVDLGLGEPIRLDPAFVDTLLAAINDRLDSPAPQPSPWKALFTEEHDERSGYFLSADKKLLFMLVEPRREAGNFTDNKDIIAGIRRTIAALHHEYPGVAAGVTGTPALSNDEMLTAFRDSAVATVVACLVTLGVVLATFRRVKKPLVMFFVLMVSLAWSLGLIALTVGHLTVFSVMFISLFVGLGIDYGIYLLFRYEEELSITRRPDEALATTVRRAGPGIVFAALSAAGTFGVLMLTEFRGIVEFGFIGALAILMALVAMLTMFPALLVLIDRSALRARPIALAAEPERRGSVRLLERVTQHAPVILCGAALLTAYSVWASLGVGFDYNRLNLQAKGTESVIWEQKIVASGGSGFPALGSARTLPELREKQDAFARLPVVSDVVSVLSVIPKEQDRKIALIRDDLAPTLAPVRVGSAGPEEPTQLRAALSTLRERLALAIREAGEDGPSARLLSADGRARDLLERLGRVDTETRRRLEAIQAEFRLDFEAKVRKFQTNLAPTRMTVDDLPEELRRKFIGRTGELLMRISPSVNTWNRDGVERFVAELRTVDAAVTGSPVISYEASRMMERAYFEGTLYAALLVLALAAVMLRRASDTVLSVLPMVLATLWTVGFMKLAGVSFNLANVWALPLIIGAAAEYGLNVALRHREAVEIGGSAFAHSTVMAVVLNGLTTITGFSSLMLARHQGVFGLGLVLTVGALAGLAASLIVLPVLLRLWSRVTASVGADVRLATASMTRKRLCVILTAVLPFVLASAGPATAGEPTERVRSTVDDLYRVMSTTSGLSLRERESAAARVMDDLFDWRAMARDALRQHWEGRSASEREEFTRLFADLFRRAYVARVSLVDAKSFNYLGDKITGDRATVTTQVATKRGSTINVAYALERDADRPWRVQDVLVEGMSLLENYRTQFTSIITRSSYETLVQRLRSRVQEQG